MTTVPPPRPGASRAVYALGVVDLLADGPLSAEELATKAGMRPQQLRQVLRKATSTGPGRTYTR